MGGVQVTKEIIDECINFIGGFKAADNGDTPLKLGHIAVKCADFPESLLKFRKEKWNVVIADFNDGESLDTVASRSGLIREEVYQIKEKHKDRTTFYYKYKAFEAFARPISEKRLIELDDLPKALIATIESLSDCGIYTVGELIDLYVHNTLRAAQEKSVSMWRERKNLLFNVIRNECYKLL